MQCSKNKSLIASVLAFALTSASLVLLQAPASASTTCVASDFDSTSGDGSSFTESFKISTKVHLRQLDYCTGTSHASKFFTLINDIDLKADDASATWSPIGYVRAPTDPFNSLSSFHGKLDGNGYAISGLEVDISDPADLSTPASGANRSAGLFRTLSGATITNLEISGSVKAGGEAGMLSGFVRGTGTQISKISVFADVTSTLGFAGGLVGWNDSTPVNSYSSITVQPLAGTGKVSAFFSAGGIIALLGNASIRESASFIDVEISDGTGITTSDSNIWAGGIAASLSGGEVYDSVATGDVSILRDNTAPFNHAGGLIGTADSSGTISNSVATGSVFGPHVAGGLVGWLRSVSIENSGATGVVTIASTSRAGEAGGLVGEANQTSIRSSFATGNVSCSVACATTVSSKIGGLVGTSDRTMYENVIATGDVFSGATGQSLGGIAGALLPIGTGNQFQNALALGALSPSGASTFGGAFGLLTHVSAIGSPAAEIYYTASQVVTDDSGGTNTVFATSLSPEAFSDISTFASWDIRSASAGDASVWRLCDYPVLFNMSLPSGCQGASPVVESDPQTDALISPASGPFSGDTSTIIRGRNLSSVTGIKFGSTSATNTVIAGSRIWALTPPGSGTVDVTLESSTNLVLPSAFTYTALGPSAALQSAATTPTSISIQLLCEGVCGSGDSYSFVASITPAHSTPSVISGNAIAASTTLEFNDLSPNTFYTVQASVTFNGETSATSSAEITTPKPIATISAISVLDASAALTVGCTNCGADPDSFVITAIPQAGGAAITSSTNVVSGLTSETTYSFAVVVRFAGVDSDSVNWQSNPVMTLPFVPIISSVSPAALPINGGTVTVTGSNFSTSNEVTLDGATVSFTVVSGTTITFTAPQKTAGDYAISITNLVGSNTLANAVRFVSGPSLSTNSPLVGTANGGTIVTLTGTDLGTASKVELGLATVSFSVLSETAIRFVTPDFNSGVFDISGSPILNIKVTTVGGTATLTNGFEYTTSALVPVVSAVTPSNGPFGGGTTITVTGQYFSGSYSDSVSAAINGISGSSIVLIDDSTLTFVSPAGAAASGLDVTVATGGGLGTLAGAFSYTAPPEPSNPGSAPQVAITTPMIVEFSTREISASGAEVTATGQRLENASVLTLGGITVTIVSNTATSLTFTTGEMPVGVWDLRLVGANGTLVFQNAISVIEARAIVAESTGELLGYTWTLRFRGNSRSLHDAQQVHLNRRLNANSQAETIICWGYTTSSSPNAWAIAHATQRARAACDLALANNSDVKTVVRLRYGVEKNWAMRSAVQFWR